MNKQEPASGLQGKRLKYGILKRAQRSRRIILLKIAALKFHYSIGMTGGSDGVEPLC
ncbi:MAG TPA: hypothetical protein VL121_14885 [Agriterribacter sp.]|nr:hypothetical protein [Agriterribacter sp.]HTN08019.1 hypothetical protein [Agriterribacter sp.]